MSFRSSVRRAFDRARHLPASRGRTDRWPAALSALLLAASTASVVATANSAPQFGGMRLSNSVAYEGETVTLVGVYSDPDDGDRHTLLVYWYGGDSNEKQKILLPAGGSRFQATHVYADDFPPQPVKVVIYDHDLPDGANDNTGGMRSDTEFLHFEVRNVAPKFVEDSIRVEKKGKRDVVVEGDFTDPGTADEMQMFATWSDPASPETTRCSLSNGNRHFRCEHTYTQFVGFGISRTYTVGLVVKDDDGGFDQHETKVRLP
jgi:hypothetical protein